MKILFVCRKNNGRSQMAKGIARRLAPANEFESAGLEVDRPGQTLSERATESGSEVATVVQVMNEIGIDVSDFTRQQFVEKQMKDYDRVVFILPTDQAKDYLVHKNAAIWEIDDPRGKSIDDVRTTRDFIAQCVMAMLAEIND